VLGVLQDGAGGKAGSWSLEPVNHEGWRVDVDEGGGKRGWLLLRQSLHDPLLVLNVESDTPGGAWRGWLVRMQGSGGTSVRACAAAMYRTCVVLVLPPHFLCPPWPQASRPFCSTCSIHT
jgi:hypothetical protein